MKNANVFLSILFFFFLSVQYASPQPLPEDERFDSVTRISDLKKHEGFREFSISHLGEVTQDTKYVGDVVHFRIYIPALPFTRYNIEIINELDKNLNYLSSTKGGKYDPGTRRITWEIEGHRPIVRRSFIEFQAKCSREGRIVNRSIANIISNIGNVRRRVVQTNSVLITIYKEPKLGWIPFDRVSAPDSMPKGVMKEETTISVMLNFDIPGMYADKRIIDKYTYHVLSIPGKSNRLDIGKPSLPIIGQMVEVPFGVDFTTEIVKSSTVSLDRYNVIPAQAPEPEQGQNWQKFEIDKNIYGADNPFPERTAEITAEDIAVIRGHRLVFLKVNPIQYNPVTKKTVAFQRIEVRINFSEPAQIRGVSMRIRSAEFEKLLESSLLNYKDQNRFYAEEMTEEADQPEKLPGCDYLIITHQDFYTAGDSNNSINQLANWKRQKGLTTRIEIVSAISSAANSDDISNDIRNYIQNVYNHWYPVPTYILIVGDVDRVPTNDGSNHNGHRTLPNAAGVRFPTPVGTDLYYATVDPDPKTGNSDYFPDIYVGRISADATTDVDNAIDKILHYEQNPPTNQNYYNDTSIVRLFEDDTDPPNNPMDPPDPCPEDGEEDCGWILIEEAEDLRNYILSERYNVERIYNHSGNWAAGPQIWRNGSTPLPPELTMAGDPPNGIPGFPWTGDHTDIVNAFNAGRFLISYRGHGGRAGWGNPDFHTWDFGGLTNVNTYPIIFGLTCQTGWFDNETDHADLNTNTDCFAEQIIRLNNSGAVAIIASARNSWGVANNPSTKGMFDALWPDFDATISSGRLLKMGQINTYSKVYMANHLGAGDPRHISFEMQNLFGDPEMTAWTEEPGNLSVNHPAGIGATGEQDFIVTVTDQASADPVPSASVTLTRDDSIIATRQTNAGGVARFTMPGPGSGEAQVTVTASDFRPNFSKLFINPGGAVLTRLDPGDGVPATIVNVGGLSFSGSEDVNIHFRSAQVATTKASGGKFGEPGMDDVIFELPASEPLGPANVLAHGQTSDRYGVNVFSVRTANPIDLEIYSQWDESTWTRFPNIDHVTWNNPDIQLYDGTTPVESDNLNITKTYKIRAKITNDSSFTARNAKVTFKWALYGAGQHSQVWTDITSTTNPITLNVPPGGAYAEITGWKPPSTGHVCIRAFIYHVEDINESNNFGQENCHVGETASPAKVKFIVYNPTKKPAMVHLELRQIVDYKNQNVEKPTVLWLTYLKHPDPQTINAGQRSEAWAIVEPHPKAKSGDTAEFALTAFINREMIGGINFIIRKE